MAYSYLPGVQISTNDGGLTLKATTNAKQTIVLGTASQGTIGNPYTVLDRATAASHFGLAGTLIAGMEEVAQGGSDNILLFRVGAKQATLSGIGLESDDAADPGFSVVFGQITPTTANDYRVYYDGSGLLEIWYKGNQVFSNNPANPIDTGDCAVSGSATLGVALKDSTVSSGTDFQKSIPLSHTLIAHSTQTSGTGGITFPALVYFAGDTGLSLTPGAVGYDPCALYEALQDAYNLLELLPLQQVYPANVPFDAPNVAFYHTGSATSDANNPANGQALGWLKTTEDSQGNKVYAWAHKTKDSAGTTITPPTLASAAARLTAGFHEVNFGYQLARFCAVQSQNQGGCIGFIGFNGPKNFKPTGIKSWIGALPAYDGNGTFENQMLGAATAAGSGLCGNAYLVGTVSGKLNNLCNEIASSSARLPGFFQTVSATDANHFGEYDEAMVIDQNGYQTDIGAFVHPVGDWALLSNSYATTYANSIAGVVAGRCSVLDEKLGLTNKSLPNVTQLYRLTMTQMNNLVQAKVNVMRFKGDNAPAVLLHDRTAALLTSDYTFLLRTRIKFLVTGILFTQADTFVGQSAATGLTIAALNTALDAKLLELQKRGYLGGYNFDVYSTLASQRIGQLFVNIVFQPANELVKITANVSAGNV